MLEHDEGIDSDLLRAAAIFDKSEDNISAEDVAVTKEALGQELVLTSALKSMPKLGRADDRTTGRFARISPCGWNGREQY